MLQTLISEPRLGAGGFHVRNPEALSELQPGGRHGLCSFLHLEKAFLTSGLGEHIMLGKVAPAPSRPCSAPGQTDPYGPRGH